MLPNAGQLFKLSLMEPIVKILGPLPGTTMLLGKTSHVLKNELLAPIFFSSSAANISVFVSFAFLDLDELGQFSSWCIVYDVE
jgi:hypothetical protein